MTADLETATDLETDEPAPSRGLRTVLIAALVVAALVIAGATGWLLGDRGSSSVSASSVDAGFARDMSAHHDQAVQMAGYTRDHTDNPSIKLLAYDIETAQYVELGQMQGWLDGWGLSRSSTIPQMSWMSGHAHLESDGLMPGMATQAEINKLLSLTGKPLDIYFLQLMIRHHQGGIPMAQYAAAHASQSYVRDLARKMVQNQSNEIVTMEQLLRQMGGSPLPPPDR
jgi:uncharacterized protein (DUF305 family)